MRGWFKGSVAADEGELRLFDEEAISNWVTGRLQVFLDGSWSQICAGEIGAPDADVACRQLGYGAGTVVPPSLVSAERAGLRTNVRFPEVAITSSGCTGSEDRLVNCSRNATSIFSRECVNSDGYGVVLACVRSPEEGVRHTPVSSVEGSWFMAEARAHAIGIVDSRIRRCVH